MRLQATIEVNGHLVKVTVEGSGALEPEKTLREIAEHCRAIEAGEK